MHPDLCSGNVFLFLYFSPVHEVLDVLYQTHRNHREVVMEVYEAEDFDSGELKLSLFSLYQHFQRFLNQML